MLLVPKGQILRKVRILIFCVWKFDPGKKFKKTHLKWVIIFKVFFTKLVTPHLEILKSAYTGFFCKTIFNAGSDHSGGGRGWWGRCQTDDDPGGAGHLRHLPPGAGQREEGEQQQHLHPCPDWEALGWCEAAGGVLKNPHHELMIVLMLLCINVDFLFP